MRRSIAFFALAGAAMLAACNGGGSDATDPRSTLSADRNPTSCSDITQQQINDLFPPSVRGSIASQLAHIRDEVKKGQTAAAQNDMFLLWQQILNLYYAGTLNGGQSQNTQTMTLTMGANLYCLVGLDGSSFLTGNPLDPNNKLQVVFPSGGSQDVISGNGDGGTHIPGGSLTGPGTVVLVLDTHTYDPWKGPLHTKLDQYGPFFEIHIVPAQTLNTPIDIAMCLDGVSGGDVPPSVHLAHNVGNGIEILGKETSFIDCSQSSSNMPTAKQYFAWGEPWKGVKALGRSLVSAVTPREAWANTLGVGGKSGGFSPYGGVDTAVVMEPTTPLFETAPIGSNVPTPPQIRVRTTGASTPLDNVNVSFNIYVGGGALGPTNSSTVNGVTDNNGLFGVTYWQLGAVYDSVQATASWPTPPSGGTVGIFGQPVRFGALGTDILTYEAGGYRYLAGPADHDAGFESPSFNDASWAVGQGGFSDHTPAAPYCPIDAEAHSPWASANPPTDMLLRHGFTLPQNFSGDLKVAVAIDNDVEIWVDGNSITPGGFQTHEGCATRDSFIFTIPNSALAANTTNHVIAVRARDRGVAAYADIRLYVPTP